MQSILRNQEPFHKHNNTHTPTIHCTSMSKSLRHYKRRNNKTQRKRRSSSGGKQRNNLVIFNGNRGNLNELDALLNNPHVLALHSSNTCGHCKTFKPVWGKVIQRLNSDPALALAELDSDATAHMNEHHYRRHNYEVNGVPTIVYINKINNNKPVEFSGERTENAIIDWLNNQSGKRIKITIETEDKTPAVESSFPAPESPVSDVFPESVSSETLSEPVSSDTLSVPVSETLSEPVSETLSSDSVSDAFPPAEAPAEAPTSVVGTIKNAASSVNNAIGSTVEKAKNALTQDIDLSGLFSSAATAAPAVTPATAATAAPAATANPDAATAPPAVTPAPPAAAAASLPADFQQAPIQPVPQVPSLGGRKHKITRRKKSKKSSSKKSKKSKSNK